MNQLNLGDMICFVVCILSKLCLCLLLDYLHELLLQ